MLYRRAGRLDTKIVQSTKNRVTGDSAVFVLIHFWKCMWECFTLRWPCSPQWIQFLDGFDRQLGANFMGIVVAVAHAVRIQGTLVFGHWSGRVYARIVSLTVFVNN